LQAPPALLALVPIGFLVVFGGLWFLIVTLLGAASGWRKLEARFPDHPDEEVATFKMASGVMGAVRMNNVLTFTACRSGMRVSIWKAFGPQNSAFLVPWEQLTVRRQRLLFEEIAILDLGSPRVATLKIRSVLADKLALASDGRWPERIARPVTPIVE